MVSLHEYPTLLLLGDRGLLREQESPSKTFDPRQWQRLHYKVYTIPSKRAGWAGEVKLSRNVLSDGDTMTVDYRKFLGGNQHQQYDATISRRGDHMTIDFKSVIFDAREPQNVCDLYTLTKTIEVTPGALVVSDQAGRTRTDPLPRGYCVTNWELLACVPQLPREHAPALEFTLLDHMEEIKPHHRITYRQFAEIEYEAHQWRFHVYDQLGTGNVPWVYYVDPQGRLVYAVSGVYCYVLQEAE